MKHWLTTMGERVYALRRKLATGGFALLAVWLFVQVMVSPNGIIVYQKKKAEYRHLQQEIDSLKAENQVITDRNKALQSNDPKAIEKEAREQLRYAKPGEVVYIMPETKPDNAANASAATHP